MKKLITYSLTAAALAAGPALSGSFAQDLPPLTPPPAEVTDAQANAEAPADVEVLTRGPVHEAFANPYAKDPGAGMIVPKKPPEPINELPPEQKPEGENVLWIPGYWGWSEDREDFIWISGLWRSVPPGQTWVSGYWVEVADGYQWISGFWTTQQQTEITYLPVPPQSLENGPNVAAPGDDYFWVPGCWIYQQTDYVWQPGYWSALYPNWVWIPAHYVWTPLGAIFVPGYWDYPLAYRGLLFSPVYVPPIYYAQPSFAYVPFSVVNYNALMVNLWVRPSYSHYYFGNFYGPQYTAWGLQPWYMYQTPRLYDPLFAYYSTVYARQQVNFAARTQGWYNYYLQNPTLRPPTTYAAQRQLIAQLTQSPRNVNVQQIRLSATTLPLNVVTQQTNIINNHIRLTSINQQQRTQYEQIARDLRRVETKRHQHEAQARANAATANAQAAGRDRAKMPRLELPKVQLPAGIQAATAGTAAPPSQTGAQPGRGRFGREGIPGLGQPSTGQTATGTTPGTQPLGQGLRSRLGQGLTGQSPSGTQTTPESGIYRPDHRLGGLGQGATTPGVGTTTQPGQTQSPLGQGHRGNQPIFRGQDSGNLDAPRNRLQGTTPQPNAGQTTPNAGQGLPNLTPQQRLDSLRNRLAPENRSPGTPGFTPSQTTPGFTPQFNPGATQNLTPQQRLQNFRGRINSDASSTPGAINRQGGLPNLQNATPRGSQFNPPSLRHTTPQRALPQIQPTLPGLNQPGRGTPGPHIQPPAARLPGAGSDAARGNRVNRPNFGATQPAPTSQPQAPIFDPRSRIEQGRNRDGGSAPKPPKNDGKSGGKRDKR